MTMTDDPNGPCVARGYMATFHLPNGCRLIARVADAVALSSSGNDTSRSDLEVQTADRRVVRRVDLTALREGYEAGGVSVWSVPHAGARLLVFESPRR